MSNQEEILQDSNKKIAMLNSYLSNTMSTRYEDIYHPRVDIRKISKLKLKIQERNLIKDTLHFYEH